MNLSNARIVVTEISPRRELAEQEGAVIVICSARGRLVGVFLVFLAVPADVGAHYPIHRVGAEVLTRVLNRCNRCVVELAPQVRDLVVDIAEQCDLPVSLFIFERHAHALGVGDQTAATELVLCAQACTAYSASASSW